MLERRKLTTSPWCGRAALPPGRALKAAAAAGGPAHVRMRVVPPPLPPPPPSSRKRMPRLTLSSGGAAGDVSAPRVGAVPLSEQALRSVDCSDGASGGLGGGRLRAFTVTVSELSCSR